jgi:serine/threonine protein kinase
MDGTQVGGKFLGSGQYGCVFMPPLLCKGKRRLPEQNNLISKIVPKEDDIISEIEIAKVLRTIPFSRNYFLYSIDNVPCELAPESQQLGENGRPRKDIFACDKLQSKGTLSYFRMYRMPYGGKTKFIYNNVASLNYWQLGKHLLEGLSLLLVSGVVHLDLHSSNIVIDEAKVPRIIDWGFANQGPNASKDDLDAILNLPFATTYYQQPPEFPLFIQAHDGGSIDNAMAAILVGRKKTTGMIQQLLGVDGEIIIEQFESFRHQTLYLEKRPDFTAWWKSHWHTYDSWSLGNILLRLGYELNAYTKPPLFNQPFYADKKDKIINTLRGMCNFNCFDRMNAVQALAAWDSPNNPIIIRFGRKWL